MPTIKSKLSRNPQDVGDGKNTWYYEEPKGIEIIHYPKGREEARPIHIFISWRKLKGSVRRKWPNAFDKSTYRKDK